MLSNVHIICLHNSFPEFFTKSAQPQEELLTGYFYFMISFFFLSLLLCRLFDGQWRSPLILS